jgi:multicomponent K+:H+ antiporter subunit D
MADLAQRLAGLDPGRHGLARVAGALLLVVFGVKAALVPLNFWLPQTYSVAAPAVAALFAVLTKVGIYAIARVLPLLFGVDAGAAGDPSSPVLVAAAVATLAVGAAGVLAARRLAELVAYLVIASSGTLLLGLALGSAAAIAAALVYLADSTLVAAALFLLVDRIASARERERDWLRPDALSRGRAGYGTLFFVLALAAAGFPPLAGFVGKSLLLAAAVDAPLPAATFAVVLGAGLVLAVALLRAGVVVFWERIDLPQPSARRGITDAPQRAAIALLLVAIASLAVCAGPLASYARSTSEQLLARRPYIDAVLHAMPATPATPARTSSEGLGR